MRRITLLSYSIPTTLLASLPTTLLVSFLAACGGDGSSSDPAHFTTASEAQRERAIAAAAGSDAGMAFFVGAFSAAAPSESTCPTVTRVGTTSTAVFDCSDSEGNRIDGRIVAANLGDIFGDGGPAADPTKDLVLTFDGYHQHAPVAADEVLLDGSVTLRPDQSLVVSLDATLQGMAVFTDATLANDGTLARASEGSSIDLDGVGRATIHGAWSMDSENPAGALELHGADTMVASFADAFGGCVPITIDGHAAGQLCDPQQ